MERNDLVNVRVLFVGQYKEGKKSMVKFALDSEDTKNSKGFLVIDQWFDNNKPFKNISSDLIGVEMQGVVDYKQTYGANAVLSLIELYDENGDNLLA